MNTHEPHTELATWLRATPAPKRWQALQSLLSRHTGTQSASWTRRSTVPCKWRALPASVSASRTWG